MLFLKTEFYDGPDTMQYDSIEDIYDIDDFSFIGDMIIRNKMTGKKYWIQNYGIASSYVIPANNDNKFDWLSKIDLTINENRKLIPYDELIPYIDNLKKSVSAEKKKVEKIINDTKNYRERIGGRIVDQYLYLFMETFNYDYPEFHEYYLVELINGRCRIAISHTSMFMTKKYEKPEEASYGPDIETFNDLNELQIKIEREDINGFSLRASYKNKYALRTISEMISKLDDTKNKLKEKKKFIRDPNIINDYGYGFLCRYYSVEENFQCTVHGEYDEYYPDVNEACVKLKNGENVRVDLDTLRRAYEIGFSNIEDIAAFLKDHNSLEEIFD